jgi:hypothetical protein
VPKTENPCAQEDTGIENRCMADYIESLTGIQPNQSKSADDFPLYRLLARDEPSPSARNIVKFLPIQA